MTDTSLRSLRSQMKPHFLSNILNSMHYFILSERPEEAGNFVSRFAHLVRHMLDSSDKSYIGLEEEIKQLREYLHFECSRSGKSVDLQVVFQKDADFSVVLVPTMLLQPLVENALVHGIFPHQELNGRIEVRIGIADSADFCDYPAEGIRLSRSGRLFVQVRDNGLGRAASANRNSRRVSPSYGLRSIRERLRWIERKYKAVAEIRISDLQNANGLPAGTSVLLNLPLMEST
jgi:LytS/YehU family sensor histidine kinase